MRLLIFFLLGSISFHASSWSNHTLVGKALFSSIPALNDVKPVPVEGLTEFLLANEQELEVFLNDQESWMQKNLWHYKPRPEALMFKATGNTSDIRHRFARALRVNPNMKWPLYLQLLPGERRDKPSIPPELISVFSEYGYLNSVQLIQLKQGDKASPVDIVTTATDEPDHGLDIGLFTDSKTDYGLTYGFGKQPFGNPNLEYGTQAPFHMGFYHESPVVYALGGFLKETYPEYRIQLFKQLSEFAFQQGHDYWGWRFMGWGMHYIGDLSNPYHVIPVPGNSTLDTLWVGVLDILGYPQKKKDAIQLASNRHTALEDFQSLVMSRAYEERQFEHKTIKALSAPDLIRTYEDGHVPTLMTRPAYNKADKVHEVLSATMPERYVNDVNVEYSQVPDKDDLIARVRETSGDKGLSDLTDTIAELLKDFSINGSSYIQSILLSKAEESEQ